MIVLLTGAGISQESGIATFRDAGGLWEQERVEDVATPGAFAKDPDRVLAYYDKRRKAVLASEPNQAHYALARLKKESRTPVLLITQNVDDLHERAGSADILHMHGELLKARCLACKTVSRWEAERLSREDFCPACGQKGKLRPDIVWFGEMPMHMEAIEQALSQCSRFVSIGTSGNVYPAAGFAALARRKGAHVLELNLEPSNTAGVFHEGRYGKATQVVPAWVDEQL